MSDLLVVMAATAELGMMRQYQEQLLAAGIDYYVEKLDPANRGESLGWELGVIRKVLAQFPEFKTFVFTDAFDVLFYGTKEEVLSKIPPFKVLLGAERNCYPDETLAKGIKGDTPWRFANGGLLAGHREALEMWMAAVEKSAYYRPEICNQAFFNFCLFQDGQIPNANIDYGTKLFYCLHKEQGELDFEDGLPINRLCGTRPNFIHANGKWPISPTLEKRDLSLGIRAAEPKIEKLIIQVPIGIEVCEACKNRLLKAVLNESLSSLPEPAAQSAL